MRSPTSTFPQCPRRRCSPPGAPTTSPARSASRSAGATPRGSRSGVGPPRSTRSTSSTPRRTLFAVEGVSAGFHAAARHRYTGVNSADLTAGVRALAAELLAFRQHELSVRADGAPLFAGPAAQSFVSNLPFFGFGFRVDPIADATDGRLEAMVLEAGTRREVVRLLAAAREGKHLGRPDVTWTRAARVELERAVPLVADAQPLGVTTATVTVAPGRLRMIVPDAPAAPAAAPVRRISGGAVMSVLALPVAASTRRTASVALWAFATVAVALGAARAVTTTYVPVLLERIADRPGLIGAVMLVNAAAGFAVPLATGLWSDRRGVRGAVHHRRRRSSAPAASSPSRSATRAPTSCSGSRRPPSTSASTPPAPRTARWCPERFAPDRRAAATGAQEGAMLGGALAGTLVGGALIDGSPAALFVALGDPAAPARAPHARVAARRRSRAGRRARRGARRPELRLLAEVLRRDGARHVLIAQILWVGSYAALAPFMVLYAEEVLGLSAAAARRRARRLRSAHRARACCSVRGCPPTGSAARS